MSVLDRLACRQHRRDEIPNQELARDLVAAGDREGIAELAANLTNRDANIQSDCLKTLYEIGYLDAALIAPYAAAFVKLLRSRNNRLVWGAMIALATVAALAADELYPQVGEIQKAMADGSVITVDNGVKALAAIAAHNPAYNRELFPFLLQHLAACHPKDVPQHSENALPAVNATNKAEFIAALEDRLDDLTAAQQTRVKKTIRLATAR